MSYPGTMPIPNTWGGTLYSSPDGTRPATAFGTAITPGNNAYGSYATLISGANLTFDCLDLTVVVNNVFISTNARDCIVSLGIDPAGGTSYTSIADLVCGPASGYQFGSDGMIGTAFRFPLWLRSGTSIGVAASVNSSLLFNLNAFCKVRGLPSMPHALWVGSYIDQYGVSVATSAGTAFTPGGVSEGVYTQIGTLSRPAYAFEFGMGVNDATMSQSNLDVDVAIGATGDTSTANKLIVIPNATVSTSALESISKPYAVEYGNGATGAGLYLRAQLGGTIDSNYSVAIYAIG